MFHIIMNLKRKLQFKNRGVRRLAVSAANPNNPLPMQSYGLLGFTKTFTPTYLLSLSIAVSALALSHSAVAQCIGSMDFCAQQNNYDPSGIGAARAQGEALDRANQQARENRVQERIDKFRATPSYGVIVAPIQGSSTNWAGGYKSIAESEQSALNGRSKNDYKVIATFSNTCAAAAAAKGNQRGSNIIIATDRDGETALNKAWGQCEAKYGKGNCAMANDDKAMCSGYDYGVFTK